MFTEESSQDVPLSVVVTWFTGIILSTICLIAQLLLYYFLPDVRKKDQKILTQMMLARILNAVMEYLISDGTRIIKRSLDKNILTALYAHTDTVLVCWMFVYTKNLFDKLVRVFIQQKWSTLRLSLTIWLGSLLVGFLYPLFIVIAKPSQFMKVYNVLKFIILSVNVILFCKIFYVIGIKQSSSNKDLKGHIKSCIISFILVCITSLQVIITDLFSIFATNSAVVIAFCVINSYQGLAISIIFGILSRNVSN